ncbi:hypothetical protein AB0N09_28120 [Streptomyces erythrochromogenes]|uniref:hypothetical protein n=1 Tax=Streptomyces erythrochromogenes TaxID=285574 RepID=UPI00343C4C81
MTTMTRLPLQPLQSETLRDAADMTIAAARRNAAPGALAPVLLADMARILHTHFGINPFVTAQHIRPALAVLRERFERLVCSIDCTTDAYA